MSLQPPLFISIAKLNIAGLPAVPPKSGVVYPALIQVVPLVSNHLYVYPTVGPKTPFTTVTINIESPSQKVL